MSLRNDDSVGISIVYIQFTQTSEMFSQHNNNPLDMLLCSDPGVKLLWGGATGSSDRAYVFHKVSYHITSYKEGASTYGRA